MCSPFQVLTAATLAIAAVAGQAQYSSCVETGMRLHLTDGPYENYFYSDCHSSSHVIVTSPLPNSDLAVIGPRLLIAWPAGNSGIVAFFEPESGRNGTLGIELLNSTVNGKPLEPLYIPSTTGNATVGVSGYISFNESAVLTVPILGSIRTIRDFTEGPSIIYSIIQDAIYFSIEPDGGGSLTRTWLDNVTTTQLSFAPLNGSDAIVIQRDVNTTLHFGTGSYQFNASFDYPQLERLKPLQSVNDVSTNLNAQVTDQMNSLSFLSYTEKLLAGTWRFLTYFGRDSMITLLLMQSVLSEGQSSATEAVIGAVLERINRSDGSACHEEVIGDYATWTNLQSGIMSTAPSCDYKMIDTDFYLPIVMKNYFVDTDTGKLRAYVFLNSTASFLANNTGLTYSALAQFTAEKIMRTTAAFASSGGQIKKNLIHLKDDQVVGEWRDSSTGIGGGRIPYDVNTALVPAALRAIGSLSRAGLFASRPDWNSTADQYADIWENETLQFFEVSVPQATAQSLVNNYITSSSYAGPTNVSTVTSDVHFYGLALDGNDDQPIVQVMNTDDCFRHFLLNVTDQSQLSSFLNQTANHILQPFPLGLSSDVGLLVANPAFGGDSWYADTWTRSDYHGTVIWSWQMAMMAAGLGRQLGRCSSDSVPDFCRDKALYTKILSAYDHLWDLIEDNSAQLSSEVWTWSYQDGYKVEQLGAFTSTESDIRQLWSLVFLAVRRGSYGIMDGT